MQAWRVGDERAETYLRLLAEAELRRAGDQLRRLDVAAGTDVWADPGMTPFRTAESARGRSYGPGGSSSRPACSTRITSTAFAADLHAAIKVRSRLLLNWDRRRGMLHRTMFAPSVRRRRLAPLARRCGSTPIGRALRVAGDRAPSALHLMSLVRTETEAVITVVMRMHWPPDGSSADLELTGAGPHHCRTTSSGRWTTRGLATRSGSRAVGAGRSPGAASPGCHPCPRAMSGGLTWSATEPASSGSLSGRRQRPAAGPRRRWPKPVAIGLGERLLVLEAERILASGDARGPVEGPVPGEIITVLTETGAIAADSPVPGQLAALCQRLGAAGHGITVPPAGEIPAPWASVIAHREAPEPAGDAEVFAPLACVLPDVDGARFALTGLNTAAGESHLHVISSGMPQLADRFQWDWTPGFSWWLKDTAGNWHVATAGEPCTLEHGMQAFWLRLTPPLATVPDAAEIVVTGPATRARATVTVRPRRDRRGPSP